MNTGCLINITILFNLFYGGFVTLTFTEIFSEMGKSFNSRGARKYTENPYHRLSDSRIYDPDKKRSTIFREVEAKSIVNKVESPDLPFYYSMNPYQGCEHGCTYCYARKTHLYLDHDAGLDFESIIYVKTNAAELLEKKIRSGNWEGDVIALSGNTDCYQPAEIKYGVTRKILEVCLKYGNPVSIVTKSGSITRDIDILKKMAEKGLVKVHFSIHTLNDELRRNMEPRASSIPLRLKTTEKLSSEGIRVEALIAPVIPGLNDYELMAVAKELKNRRVADINYMLLRLDEFGYDVFEDWLEHCYPDRKNKVLNLLRSVHNGSTTSTARNGRKSGKGTYSEHIKQVFHLAKNTHFNNVIPFEFQRNEYYKKNTSQLSLF